MIKNKIKTIITVVAIILCLALAGGWIAQTVINKQKANEPTVNTTVDEPVEGMQLDVAKESNGVKLTSARIASEDYDEYGVSAQAESAYTLTASNDSGDSSLERYVWSFTFKDGASSWANGKKASDYITVTPSSNSKTAIVSCKQEFGETIIITVASEVNRSATATCTVEYVKKITDISFTVNNDRIFVLGSQNTFRLNPVYGVGTQTGDLSIESVSVTVSKQIEDDVYLASHAMTGQYWMQTATFSPDSSITPFDLMWTSRGDFPYLNDGKLAYNAVLKDANPSLAVSSVFYLDISVSYNYAYKGDTVQSGDTATAQHPYSAGTLTEYTVVASVSVDKTDIAF